MVSTPKRICAHATARDKSWAGGESIAGAGLVVEVVATFAALFVREKRGRSGEEKEMGAGDTEREAGEE